jgi:hypothetical protein
MLMALATANTKFQNRRRRARVYSATGVCTHSASRVYQRCIVIEEREIILAEADGWWPMPLLRYFVFVGSALLGLVYLVGSVLPHATPTHINSKTDALPVPSQPKPQNAVVVPRTAPTMSFAAVPDGRTPQAGASLQESNAVPAPAAKDIPPRKKRKAAPRQPEWQDSFAQADGWRRDQRRWTDRSRGDNGWRNSGWRNNDRRDQGWRNQGSRDPFWGSSRRGPGWRW